MTHEHKIVSAETIDHGRYSFNWERGAPLLDEKNRRVGVSWLIAKVTTRPPSIDDDRWEAYWPLDWACTTHFTVIVQAERDENIYGACQPVHRFLTIGEAYQKRDALREGTYKRYAKKYRRATGA